MNIFIIIIWISNLVVFTFVSIYSYKILKTNIKNRNKAIQGIIPDCKPSLNDNNLIEINDSSILCQNGNYLLDYVKDHTLNTLKIQVTTTQKYFMDACSSACITGINNSGGCIDDNGSSDLALCLSLSEPSGCKATAIPVAKQGNIFYYVNTVGDGTCTVKTPS